MKYYIQNYQSGRIAALFQDKTDADEYAVFLNQKYPADDWSVYSLGIELLVKP